jgi:hypothetical protein
MPLSSVVGAQSVIKPGVCTSTTRPASPYEGQVIYETDTDLVLAWSGSAWFTVGPTTVRSYAVASGGNSTSTITSGGISYKLHTFTANGSLTVSTAGYVDLLLVGAGGQGGGSGVSQGGAGGGGDLLFVHSQFLPAATYTVTIGAGNTTNGRQGGPTKFTSSDNNTVSFMAPGGGSGNYGGGWHTYGGSAGGGGVYGGAQGGGYVHWAYFGNAGGTASGGNAGGGGGAATAASGLTGGNGLDISLWLGQTAGTTYKGGGGAGTSGTAGLGTGAANTGGGGNATSGNNAGWSGIAYVRSKP